MQSLRQIGNRFLYSGISFVQRQKLDDDEETPATVRMKRDRTERTTRAWANKRLNYESICTHLAINSFVDVVTALNHIPLEDLLLLLLLRRAAAQAE